MALGGKKVVVTGGAGFLGRRVCTLVGERGAAEVLVPRRADVDLTEQQATRDYLHDVQPHVILHLAAEVGGIGANRANPGRYFYANAAMGINLIEGARETAVEKFVQVGTICSYPKHTPTPFREDDLWDGYPEDTNAPYGVAKKALLVMLQAYREQYGLNGIYLLPVNLYGPEDNFDPETSHVIPALIRKFVAAREAGHDAVELWGTGTPTREFLYVDDAAEGIAAAADRYAAPEPVNLGSGEEITIGDLAALIAKLVGYSGDVHWDITKPDGQPRRQLDTSRARERFGWEAKVGLEDGLRRTIAWWKSHGTA